MGGGTETVPPNDYGTNLGRQEEKDSYRSRENASEEVHGKVCLDSADAVIDEMTVGRGRLASELKLRHPKDRGAWPAGASGRGLRGVDQRAQGRICGLFVGEISSYVRGEEDEIRSCSRRQSEICGPRVK